MVGMGGEAAHVFAQTIGLGDGLEFLFPLDFGGGGWLGTTAQGGRGVCRTQDQRDGEEERGEVAHSQF
jgi:hypothetical protein